MSNEMCLDTFYNIKAWISASEEAHNSEVSLLVYLNFLCNERMMENEGWKKHQTIKKLKICLLAWNELG